MNIWYWNHYSGSIEEPRSGRTYFLSKSLENLGHNVAVFSGSYHHLMKNKNYHLVENSIERKEVDGIDFFWLKLPKYKGNGFSRIRNMLAYARHLWKNDFVKEYDLSEPDVIIVSSAHPFHLFSGFRWSRKYKAKLIFEVRDLWPLSLNLILNVPKFHPLSLLLSIIERVGYKHSDLVVSLLSNSLEYMKKRGLKEEKFLYLPNGLDRSFGASKVTILEKELLQIREKYQKVVMHTGSMGIPNGLEALIAASNFFAHNNDIAFVFIGKGELKEILKEKVCSLNVYFFDPIPKEEIQAALKYCDICYCGAQYIPDLYKYGISPNKLFDYMLAGKTIILNIKSPGNPVEMARCGFIFDTDSDSKFIEEFKKVVFTDRKVLNKIGKKGVDYVLKNHDFGILAQILERRILEILK